MAELDLISVAYPEAAKANLRTLARGGVATDYQFLSCYANYTVHEYLLGTGTTLLTAAYDHMADVRSYALYSRGHAAGEFGDEPLMTEGEYQSALQEAVRAVESLLSGLLEGRESVVFLAPMGAHGAIAIEAWQVVAQFDLQTDDDDTVNAVRYGTPANDPEYSQTLANLKSRITTATTATSTSATPTSTTMPTRVANASGLAQYYRDIGAYGDITPDDGDTATFTPAQPPPIPTCANGTAVTDPGDNRALVHDCEVLLDNKDMLKGTGALDWSAGTAITAWEGVTTGGTPSRVTKVELSSKSLSGSIPSELGTLFELTHLNLSANSLTGAIPAELGWLSNLEEIRLSGNRLTGCIPLALKGVATNDLSLLGLLYCAPPAPQSLAVPASARTSVDLSWDAVASTTKYRVEYRSAASTAWTVDDETITGTTHTVDELACNTAYELRVSAYGSGTTYAAAWSAPSAAVSENTGSCTAPVFDASPYAFSVAEDAATGMAVGTISATDPDPDDTVTYAITAGNADGAFAIDAGTGQLTVAAALDYETTPSYTLTVEADDNAGAATTTVTITVTDVDEATLSAGVTVTLTPREYEGAFGRPTLGTDITIEWVDPDGCDSQYFVGVYNNEELVRAERPLGLHPAPATTSVTASLGLDWDRVPDYDWWAGVSCTSTSGWTVLAKASIQSGLPMPEVAISDLGATLANGSSDAFTVDASNLDADTSYTIQVTTDDADLGFDSACTDRQEDVTVAASSTSHTASPTLYGCGAPGGTVTATLLSGTTTVHTATQDVTVPNTAATGAPAITGTVQAGETLTADTSDIADEDGLDSVSYTYQWLADDAEIEGATAATYTLSDDDVDKLIKITVTFDDDADHEETLTSAATVAVAARPNRAATGAPTITGTVQAGETLTADTSDIADEDGLDSVSYSYQWLADDAEIEGATAATYTLSDDDVGKLIKVTVTFDDDADHEETLTSAATVAVAARPNRAATGAPTITGTVQAGETLTADTSDIADEDGLDSVSYTYQWLADDAEIEGATAATYTLSDDDVDKLIKITVTFDDDADHEETLTSAATVAVAARPNRAATGAPTITGTVQAGETLTADTSDIADEDGLDSVSYTYQWLADDAEIEGATAATYTLSDDDVGKLIKITVTFDDDADHEETLTSAATVAVAARPNRAATGAPTISGTVQAGETLTADTSDIADEDGLDSVSYTYQWLADDAEIEGATAATYTLSDDDVGKLIKITVTFDDDADHEETLTSAATVAVAARPNRAATGAPTISGTVQAGETLTADTSDIADEDGLDSVSYSYQWLADDADIAGATSSTYELSDDDVGKLIKITVTFDDDADHEETLTSAATVAVAARPNRAATGAPTITGTVQAGETLTADTSDIADEDGLDSVSYTYQWLADDAEIEGATAATYTLSDDDVGKLIKITVTFDDDADHEETLTSAATVAVAARPNRAATGAPTISGTVQAGETLTADTSDIADEDGLDSVSYTYQWLADDAEIEGATAATYTLSDDDVGKLIKITVTFDDDADHEETLTSAATVAVAARPNRAATGAPTISGTVQAGETLTADTSDIADEDGLDSVSYSYQWLADDADIAGATSSTYELSDDDVGKLIKITVTFDDDADHEETLTSAATVAVAARPNRAATGAPTISGTVRAGETLTADTSDIADEDGLDSVSYSYQWLADDADIAGATSSTYELSDDDVGKLIKITVTFDDDADHEETLTSAATEAVAARPSTPGLPTISGTVRVGETLTADTSDIADEDGLDSVSYSYQWLADDAEIEGATAATYTLSDDDVGKVIKVTVTFDDDDNEETRTSEATVAVTSVLTASFENTPAGHDGRNSFTFEVRFSEEVSVGFRRLKDHAFSVTDGATITRARRLERGSSLRWEITVLPGSRDDVTIALPATTDCTTQGAICTTSGKMLSERVELTVRDMGARGAPVISGTVRAGKALTADTSGISDPNGLDNVSYSYQWIADDVDIAEATASTYTLSDDDAGKVIKVRVSFDDDADNEETLTSVATVAVVASGPVWTADVSVVDYGPSVGAGSASLLSNEGGSGGLDALWLWYGRTDRQLHLTFTTSVADVDDLILQVGDLSFTFPEGSSGRTFTFSDVDAVDWTDGQTLSASLIWADDVEDES